MRTILQSASLFLRIILYCSLFDRVAAFTPLSYFSSRTSRTIVHYCSAPERRRNVELPLLDVLDSEYNKAMIQPLPSTHLPDEMTTLHVYGMQLTRPVHILIVDDAVERGDHVVGEVGGLERAFGHVAYKPDPDSYVGAIGCTSEVLLNAVEDPQAESKTQAGRTVLCRGSYRFVVKEVVKSIPYPVAIVDELYDDQPGSSTKATTTIDLQDDDEEEDDDDDDMYADLEPSQLEQRTMAAMKTLVDQQLEVRQKDMSPLEQSILEDGGAGLDMNAQQQAAEEMAAVFEVFQQYLIDLCPAPIERYFAIAFMAAEMANMSNQVRRKILVMTDGVERLRYVLEKLEEEVGMARARKMANAITDETDEGSKDLKIGTPELPQWAKAIRKGMRVEYFWNEKEGWCEGEVAEDPVLIVDELILTLYFEDDGSTHKIPFRADEKARWRPARAQ